LKKKSQMSWNGDGVTDHASLPAQCPRIKIASGELDKGAIFGPERKTRVRAVRAQELGGREGNKRDDTVTEVNSPTQRARRGIITLCRGKCTNSLSKILKLVTVHESRGRQCKREKLRAECTASFVDDWLFCKERGEVTGQMREEVLRRISEFRKKNPGTRGERETRHTEGETCSHWKESGPGREEPAKGGTLRVRL